MKGVLNGTLKRSLIVAQALDLPAEASPQAGGARKSKKSRKLRKSRKTRGGDRLLLLNICYHIT